MDKRADILATPAEVVGTLCSRFRCVKSDCAACAVMCPEPGAVRLGEGGAEIDAACVGCGACASACPNGAIRLREDDRDLAGRIRQRAREGAVFRIACTGARGRADLVLPCLSRLTEALVLEPIRSGARRVELCAPDCEACGLRKAAPQWERTMVFSRLLCESAGLDGERVVSVRAPGGKAEKVRAPARVSRSRRALFRAIAERWQAAAPETEGAARATEPFREAVQRHGENRKRTELLRVLETLPGARVTSKMAFAEGLPLARLDVDGRCVGCNVCATLCPVGALQHREGDGHYALAFDAARCTGCRVCERACYYQAIHVREMVDLASLFERNPVTLLSAPRRACRACGAAYLGDASDFCPACRVSGERREAVARCISSGGVPG